MAIYGIVAISLVVLTGWAGQISLGQFAFVAVGAGRHRRASTSNAGVDLFLALLVATVVGAATAVLDRRARAAASRADAGRRHAGVRGAGVDLAAEPGPLPALTPAEIPRPELSRLPRRSRSPRTFAATCVVALAAAWLLMANLRRTRAGRAIIGVRDNERAAASYGIDPVRVRLVAFAFAGALCGLGRRPVRPRAARRRLRRVRPGRERRRPSRWSSSAGSDRSAPRVLGAVYVRGRPVLPRRRRPAAGHRRRPARARAVPPRRPRLGRYARARPVPAMGCAPQRTRPRAGCRHRRTRPPACEPATTAQERRTDDVLLDVRGVDAGYGPVQVLFGTSLHVGRRRGARPARHERRRQVDAAQRHRRPPAGRRRRRSRFDGGDARRDARRRRAAAAGIALVPGGAGGVPLAHRRREPAARWLAASPRPRRRGGRRSTACSRCSPSLDARRADARRHALRRPAADARRWRSPCSAGPGCCSSTSSRSAWPRPSSRRLLDAVRELNRRGHHGRARRAVARTSPRRSPSGRCSSSGAACGSSGPPPTCSSATTSPAPCSSAPRHDARTSPKRPVAAGDGRRARRRCSRSAISRSASAASTRSATSTSTSAPTRSSGSSAATARARPRCSTSCSGFVDATARPRRASTASTSPSCDRRLAPSAAWAGRSRAPACSPRSRSPRRWRSRSSATSTCASRWPARCASRPRAARRRPCAAGSTSCVEQLRLGRYRNAFISELSTGTRRIVELGLRDGPPARGPAARRAVVGPRPARERGPRRRARSTCAATSAPPLVIVEHDIPLVSGIADRLVCLHLGQVLADRAAPTTSSPTPPWSPRTSAPMTPPVDPLGAARPGA